MSEERERPAEEPLPKEGPLSFEELDREDLEERAAAREEDPAPVRPPSGRYGWLIGVLVFFALVYILINNISTEGPGSRGVPPGEPMPPFAVPLALSGLEGDANVATEAGQGDRGARPACEVRGPRILNICQLAEGAPVVLAFLATRGGECERQLDVLERVRRTAAARGIHFAAVAVRGDREELRRDIRRRGWRFPVGYDRDGLVANVYGVSVCPTITFAYPGRVVRRTTLGFRAQPAVAREVAALARASRARGWRPAAGR